MTVKLNRPALNFAEELIGKRKTVLDERKAWHEHRPSAEEENEFIKQHGFPEYGKCHLDIDNAHDVNTKKHYKLIIGHFKLIHRCGILAAENRSGQYKHHDKPRLICTEC